jgi:Lsr2
MARTVEVRLVDDLDGGRADESVMFGLDGTTYQIDLSSRHAKELRTTLDRFLQVARRVRHTRQPAARSRARSTGGARTDGLQNQAIREWAQRKGLAIAARGRIPSSIIERYEAEAGKKATAPARRARA